MKPPVKKTGRKPAHFVRGRTPNKAKPISLFGPPIKKETKKRYCILRRTGGIGDLLMSLPVAVAIKNNDPSAEIHFAVSFSAAHGQLPQLLRGNPHIDAVIPENKINPKIYEQVYDLSHIKNKFEIPGAPPCHKTDIYLSRCNLELPDDTKVPYYHVTAAERDYADAYCSKFEGELIIGIAWAAMARSRTWDKMGELILRLLEEYSSAHILVFSKSGVKLGIEGRRIHMVTGMGIRASAALMEKCSLVVTPDTGLMHIAGALARPMVCIFGSSHPDSRINYYHNVRVIWNQDKCPRSPCWYSSCNNYHRCLKSVTVDQVMKEVKVLVSKNFYIGAPSISKTPGIKKDKIIWVNEADMAVEVGRKIWGAESSNSYLMEVGKDLGVSIAEVTRKRFPQDLPKQAGTIVLNSYHRFSPEQMRALLAALDVPGRRFAIYSHDYSFCMRRNGIICGGTRVGDPRTPCMSSGVRWGGKSLLALNQDLFRRSIMNIFISPPQLDIYQKALGFTPKGIFMLLPPVSPDAYVSTGCKRNKRLVVWPAGRLRSWNKGWKNVLDFIVSHPEYEYELYGEYGPEIEKFCRPRENVNLMGVVDSMDLIPAYSRAQYVMALPANVEPAGRTPVEGALCGAIPIMNDNVGIKHYDLPLGNRDALASAIRNSAVDFWKALL